MVADDEDRLAAALKRGLDSEGFSVEVASDGLEGWWLATEQTNDMIGFDILLPGLNRYQSCARLRQSPARHDTVCAAPDGPGRAGSV